MVEDLSSIGNAEVPLQGPDPAVASLENILDWCWRALSAGALSARHPYHLGVVATGRNQARTVVLRRVEPKQRQVLCHSDFRSRKVTELARDSAVGWLFYDMDSKVQLRLEGTAEVHHDDSLADTQWSAARLMSRRCYLADPAPGAASPHWDPGLSAELLKRAPSAPESESGRENFCVIATRVTALEWLHIAAQGHGRARFEWTESGLDASWLIP